MIAAKLQEVVKEYDIRFDKETLVPADDNLADSVFNAALDFFTAVGSYHMDTERIIKFDENEIRTGIKNVRHKVMFGEGKQSKPFSARKPESKDLPWTYVGAGIAASSEQLLSALVEGYASIPEADAISVPSLTKIDGIDIRSPPLEFYASVKMLSLAHKVFERVGRPGLPIMNLLSTAASQIAGIAASGPQYGTKPSDGWLIPTYPDLKIYNDALTKAAYLHSWDANAGSEYTPLIGGYSGGPEGTAVVAVAYSLNAIMVLDAVYQLYFISNIMNGCTSSRDALWATAMSGQAISRNICAPTILLAYQAAGPATDMLFYEIAANSLATIPSGLSFETVHPAKAALTDHILPIESKFSCDVAHAITGMKRTDANELAKTLLKKYEGNITKPPEGKRYQECYNVKTGEPTREYMQFNKKMRKEILDVGINLEVS